MNSPPNPLRASLEAILFAAARPLAVEELARLLGGVPPRQVAAALEELDLLYESQRRPYRIVCRSGGYGTEILPSYRALARRLTGPAGAARLSAAAVEVLAIVAYRQPISRVEIESLRGRGSRRPLRALLRANLIQTLAAPDSAAVVFQTTPEFLEYFGLKGLSDLPRSSEAVTRDE